ALRRDRARGLRRRRDRGMLGGGQREVERRPLPFLALHPDRSAVALDDLLGDVKAESEAAVIRRRDLAAAMEALEDLPELVGRNADAAIAHGSEQRVAFVVHRDGNVAAVGRILHRVLQQLAEDLLEAIAIAGDDL